MTDSSRSFFKHRGVATHSITHENSSDETFTEAFLEDDRSPQLQTDKQAQVALRPEHATSCSQVLVKSL